MPYNPLSEQKIKEINLVYEQYKSIVKVEEICNVHYKTAKKYLGDKSNKLRADKALIITAYAVNGTLQGTAEIANCSSTTVWRILKANNIEINSRGKTNSKRLYQTLRARAVRSKWRKQILERDNYKCVKCSEPSTIVHHIEHLSSIRDRVLKETGINPFESFKNLRAFTDKVMEYHSLEKGITLCRECHHHEHYN